MSSQRIRDLVNALGIIGTIATVIFLWYAFKIGLLTNEEVMKAFLNQVGVWGPLVFIFIQIVQVVIPIVPGAITIPVGAIIFGDWLGFIYNFVGIVIGSLINFYLARQYGKPLVKAITSEKTYDKYIGYLEHKNFGKVFLGFMIWPFSPDDFLCYLAGLSAMTWKSYALIILTTKAWSIYIYTYGTVAILDLVQKLLGG